MDATIHMTVMAGAAIFGAEEAVGFDWTSLSACGWELIAWPAEAFGAPEALLLKSGTRPHRMPTCAECLVLLDDCLAHAR